MKISRLAMIVAGTFLAMTAATGSTQAQTGASPGALKSSLGAWADSAKYPAVVASPHQICEETPYQEAASPSKA